MPTFRATKLGHCVCEQCDTEMPLSEAKDHKFCDPDKVAKATRDKNQEERRIWQSNYERRNRSRVRARVPKRGLW